LIEPPINGDGSSHMDCASDCVLIAARSNALRLVMSLLWCGLDTIGEENLAVHRRSHLRSRSRGMSIINAPGILVAPFTFVARKRRGQKL
jgi:hypothetical protein